MMFAPDRDGAERRIADVLADPSVHEWAKEALRSALAHDPIDAANDAELVADLLAGRAAAILAGTPDPLGLIER